MTSIYEVIGRNVADYGREATDYVMADLNVPAKWVAVFGPLVEQEVLNRSRVRTRGIEDRAFAGSLPIHGERDTHTGRDGAGLASVENPRIALLAQAVFISSEGRYIPWGELTADQHRERAQRQRDLAAAVTVTAERHEASAALIEAEGVECLNEVSGIEQTDLAALLV